MENKKQIKYIYIFNIALCFFLLVYGLICGVSGNDFWWHLKTGEWIITNGKIPHMDVFSWYGTANNYIWYAHEWLSDVIYYLIYNTIGRIGITFISILLIGFHHLFLMKITEKYWAKYTNISFLWFFYHATILLLVLQCRPYIFSFIFLDIELYLLTRFLEEDNFKGIFFVPLLGMLWSNMHGGSSNLSYIIFGIFLLIGALDNFDFYKLEHRKLSKEKLKILGITFVLTILSLFLNPYGIEMLIYPYRYMLVSNFDRQVIGEWAPIDLKTDVGLIMIVMFAALLIILIITEKKIKAIDFVLFGAFTYLLFQSIRFGYFFFIVASYIIFRYMPEKVNDFIKESIIKYACIGASILILIAGTLFLSISDFKYVKTTLSDEFVEVIKESGNERLFNAYELGEELIFNDIPVFIDSRADVYSLNGDVLIHAYALYKLNPTYIEEIRHEFFGVDYFFDEVYGFDSAVVPAYIPISTYLDKREDFVKVYEENNIIYWERIK